MTSVRQKLETEAIWLIAPPELDPAREVCKGCTKLGDKPFEIVEIERSRVASKFLDRDLYCSDVPRSVLEAANVRNTEEFPRTDLNSGNALRVHV